MPATRLPTGTGSSSRRHRYGRGPGYPATMAADRGRHRRTRSTVYFWAKLFNALWFALTAIPIYLLARRAASRRTSFVVTALSLLIPSSIYVGLVMTDSLAYLVGLVALYAIVLAVERPTWRRQLAVPGRCPRRLPRTTAVRGPVSRIRARRRCCQPASSARARGHRRRCRAGTRGCGGRGSARCGCAWPNSTRSSGARTT